MLQIPLPLLLPYQGAPNFYRSIFLPNYIIFELEHQGANLTLSTLTSSNAEQSLIIQNRGVNGTTDPIIQFEEDNIYLYQENCTNNFGQNATDEHQSRDVYIRSFGNSNLNLALFFFQQNFEILESWCGEGSERN